MYCVAGSNLLEDSQPLCSRSKGSCGVLTLMTESLSLSLSLSFSFSLSTLPSQVTVTREKLWDDLHSLEKGSVELELALTSNPAKSSAAATGTLKVASTHICGKLTQTSSASALCPALALAPSLSRARALSHESSKRVSLSLTNERTNESSKRVSVIVFRIFGGTLLNDSDASSYTQAVLVP